jgi:Flp pilus assembly protein TadG
MPRSSGRIRAALTSRLLDAAGRAESPGTERGTQSTREHESASGTTLGNGTTRPGERGSAVVEFTFLALLLMVPLVYFIITVGQIQGGAFAVVGAADQAAKVYVAQPDAESGRTAAEQAVMLALADYGHPADNARMDASCQPSDCLASGSAVTITVHLTVPLPFVPFSDSFRLNASQLDASATQVVGRFR